MDESKLNKAKNINITSLNQCSLFLWRPVVETKYPGMKSHDHVGANLPLFAYVNFEGLLRSHISILYINKGPI